MRMVQLPPTEFTYSKYGNVGIPWAAIKTTKSYYEWLLAQNIIGYCNSLECEIRPRKDDMAVMFEVDGFESWVHIPIEVWKAYLKQLNKGK